MTVTNKLILNMIVKNEAHCILNSLNSVAHLISGIVIDDTGSTDNTKEVIENFAKSKNLPFEIGNTPWTRRFDFNRNAALHKAENFIQKMIDEDKTTLPKKPVSVDIWNESKKHQKNYFILFMDADNKCVGEKGGKYILDKKQITETTDMVISDMGQGSTRYEYSWMVKYDPARKRKWSWKCPLHEYISADGWNSTRTKVTGGYIISGREGDRSKNPIKYLDDACVFELALKTEPDNERYVFYCAQSYKDSGKHEEAIKFYKKRAEMKGWQEEVYMSLLEIGRISAFIHRDKPHKALEYYMKAHNTIPTRWEAAYYILEHYRLNNMYTFAYTFGIGVMHTMYNISTSLFVDEHIHKFRLYDSVGVSAAYSGHKNEAKKLFEKALEYKNIPDGDRERISKNLRCVM